MNISITRKKLSGAAFGRRKVRRIFSESFGELREGGGFYPADV